MKNNRERILKYFSGEIEDEQKFLEDLNSDPELREDLESMNRNIFDIDAVKNIDIEENYYSTLLPKVHEKLTKRGISWFTNKYVYGLSSTIMIFILFLVFRTNTNPNMSSSEILEDLIGNYNSSELLNELDNNYSTVDYLKSDNYPEEYSEIFSDFNEDVTTNYTSPSLLSLYSNDYIENISEQQLDEIINQLENKKYF